jgi:predicted short-subunit dehydrogenase-like oxidoreductase (DUF2520 family)
MSKQLPVGLLVEGNATHSAILRLPNLGQELGPIKSTALRVARRLSHMLRAGYAVADYEELQAAQLILLRAPDADVPRIVDELCASELFFRNLAFVLCESWLMAEVLEPLRRLGASVGTLLSVPGIRHDWFVVDGQIPAVRQVRRFLERNRAKAFEIRQGHKSVYFAAELLATSLVTPLFLTAQQALRHAGISGNHLTAMVQHMAQKSFEDFVKGCRTHWGGPLTECSPEVSKAHLDALRKSQPDIAQIVDQQLAWACRIMSQPKQDPPKMRTPSRNR